MRTKDFINFRMTGKMISDYSDASFSGINYLMKWQYSEELCLAELHPSREVPGSLSFHAHRRRTAPRAGRRARYSPRRSRSFAADMMAPVPRSGRETSRKVESTTTSALLPGFQLQPENQIIHVRTKPYCYYSAVPAMFNSTVSIYSAGGSFEWVKNILCREEILAGEIAGVDPYKIMEKEALRSP